MTGPAVLAWLMLVPVLVLTAHSVVNALLLRRLRSGIHRGAAGAARQRPARGGLWSVSKGKTRRPEVTERIAVLLPLRDEAARVTPCLESLLRQRGVPHLSIHVLDDGSTDGTSDVVRSIAGDKVHLLTGAPLPQGWLGKPHACQQLADAATDADILSFIDADVTLNPDALAAAVAELRHSGVTLLSPYPKIVGTGRLVQPLLQWSWLTFLPLRAMERSPRPSLAAAGGQWLVVDNSGYRTAGGHASVRDEVLEDIALARRIKRSGGRIALADASRHATCEMYTSWPDLKTGYTKSLWASFGSPIAATAVVFLLLFLYAAPPVTAVCLAAAGEVRAAALACAAYATAVLGRTVTAAATGSRPWPDPLAHPASIVTFAYLVATSFRHRRRGILTWRGRPI